MKSPNPTTKKVSFDGLRVAAFESRMKIEMTQLIQNLGGAPFVAPSMREVSIAENEDLRKFGERLLAGEIDVMILMTGVGTRALVKTLEAHHSRERIVEALSKSRLIARSVKPVKALTELGLKPEWVVPEPNTWRDILKTIDAQLDLKGRTVAVQEYGESNKVFLGELSARDAQVIPVSVYRAEMPEDIQPLSDLVSRIVRGELDVLLFTNATQVEHVMAVARQLGQAEGLRRALTKAVVASVGPTCTEALRKFGLPVDLEPERPMMGALVAKAATGAHEILEKKKASAVEVSSPDLGRAKLSDPLYNSLFMRACRREPTERTPIWLMRQAGRYMKEYRELRAKTPFLDLCKNPELASDVTVDAAHRLGVDAAIIFSDLLLIVEPLGFDLSYGPDQGPVIANPFREKKDLDRLRSVDVETSMSYVLEAIRKTRSTLKADIPLIGFAGAPFTMASYIIEGRGSKNYVKTKKLMYEDEGTWNALLERITAATVDYLNAQIRAGVQAVQIFDSWVGCLNPEDFRKYALPHTRRLIEGIIPGTPVISFGTQTGGLLSLFKQAGGDVIGVDWRIELDEAWKILGDVAIMGNLDPVTLLSSPDEIRAHAKRILNQAGGRPGHIFNLGHGILPETSLDNVLILIKAVKEYSQR